MESGRKKYRCEEKIGKDLWMVMNDGYAIFNNKDSALRFLGKHPDQIIKSEKVL